MYYAVKKHSLCLLSLVDYDCNLKRKTAILLLDNFETNCDA